MGFNPKDDIPDLTGKVIIVTGGSSGLGKESALQLAKHNPSAIFITARTEKRGNDAIKEIQDAVPDFKGQIKFLELDLSSFASIQKGATAFINQSDRLDILMNNAGLMATPAGLTADGYEAQFGANYMGPALFTKLLLPTIVKTSEQHGGDARVINLSSLLFRQAPKEGILFSRVKTPLEDISSMARYGQSKLAFHYHTRALSKSYPTIKFVSIHPGVVNTGLLDNFRQRRPWLGALAGVFAPIFLMDVHAGAKSQLWASTAKSESVKNGGFYNEKQKEYTDSVLKDDKAVEELQSWTNKEFESKGFN